MSGIIQTIVTGTEPRPARVVCYGIDGIGKTTLGAEAPAPIFISTEQGLSGLDAARFPPPKSWQHMLDQVEALIAEPHKFKTLVLDSVDWAETLANEEVCSEHGVSGIEELGYGKGFVYASEKFYELLRALDALWLERKMHIFIIAHAEVHAFNDPERDTYDRYRLKLHRRNEPRLREWCDLMIFLNFEISVKEKKEGFKTTRKAVDLNDKRCIYTLRHAAYDAKKRGVFGDLPARMDLNPPEFWQAITARTK